MHRGEGLKVEPRLERVPLARLPLPHIRQRLMASSYHQLLHAPRPLHLGRTLLKANKLKDDSPATANRLLARVPSQMTQLR